MKGARYSERRSWLIAVTAIAATALSGIGRAQPNTAEELLPPVADLRTLAATITRLKAPLLILFSTPGCPYCREVRRNYLMPRVAEQARASMPELLLREVDITSQQSIIDLTGGRITEAAFAVRFEVRVVPVVMLFGQKMRLLAAPLIGLDRAGFYEGLLAGAIETARKQLQTA
jgi:glutaredoxin